MTKKIKSLPLRPEIQSFAAVFSSPSQCYLFISIKINITHFSYITFVKTKDREGIPGSGLESLNGMELGGPHNPK